MTRCIICGSPILASTGSISPVLNMFMGACAGECYKRAASRLARTLEEMESERTPVVPADPPLSEAERAAMESMK